MVIQGSSLALSSALAFTLNGANVLHRDGAKARNPGVAIIVDVGKRRCGGQPYLCNGEVEDRMDGAEDPGNAAASQPTLDQVITELVRVCLSAVCQWFVSADVDHVAARTVGSAVEGLRASLTFETQIRQYSLR